MRTLDFDVFPVHFVKRFGRDDREHRVKLNGFYRMPWDLTLGFDAFWSSELPWPPQAFADPCGVEFLEPRAACNPLGTGGCGTSAASLVVDDAAASSPAHSLHLHHKTPVRGPFDFCYELLY